MNKGFIIKLIGGLYTLIDIKTNKVYEGKARGKLRALRLDEKSSFNKNVTSKNKKDIKIMQISPRVGDYCIFAILDNGSIMIDEILERKNELKRPDVCNIDQVLLLFSAKDPDFSFTLLDKFLVILESNNLDIKIIISKIDLLSEKELEELKEQLKYYQNYYEVYFVNSLDFKTKNPVSDLLKNKLSVLAGQTGVGKSTLMNNLVPDLKLRTQEISKALGRGKHTTRHSQLYLVCGGYIADTPGFSKIEFDFFVPKIVKDSFIDFKELKNECKFNGCNHLDEPECMIKTKVKDDTIPKTRYDNYRSFYLEVKNKKQKY